MNDTPDGPRNAPEKFPPGTLDVLDLRPSSGRNERLYTLTDIGNAQRLIASHGHNMAYVDGMGWLVWDGTKWKRDGFAARLLAQGIAQAVYLEGLQTGDDKLLRWAATTGLHSRLEGMLKVAEPHLVRDINEFDADPYLLNVLSGTIDVRTGVLMPHDPGRLISKIAPVEFDAEATCSRFNSFLEQIQPQEDMREFLQRFGGYCCLGIAVEHALLFLYGLGANGKTTLAEAIRVVLGEYASVIPFQSLQRNTRRGGDDPTPSLAKLPGQRLVTANEPDNSVTFSETMVKQLTGGDRIQARYLHGNPFEFVPVFKLILAGNNKPRIEGLDHGIWRRILLVPFDVTITVKDPFLLDKLREELPGILNWLLDGARAYLRHGLGVPDSVRDATAVYREENDPVGEFIDEALIEDSSSTVPGARMYAAYRKYCAANAVDAVSQTKFGIAMRGHGLNKKKTRSGVVYTGITIKSDWDEVHSPTY